MAWSWVGRRRLTVGFVSFFVAWYLAQLAVVSVFGRETAVWWFYFAGDPSPGYLFASLSHNVDDFGHLRRNVTVLLVAGGLAEPYLNERQYAALLLGISSASIVVANALSLVFGTQWALAGASGGIYGLWAYIGVRNRSTILDVEGWREFVEAVLVLGGILTIVFVPIFDVYASGTVNVSHATGILIGYAVAVTEAPPRIQAPADE